MADVPADVLDAYLLAADVSQSWLTRLVTRLNDSRWAATLERCGVRDSAVGYSDGEIEALIRLRIALSDGDPQSGGMLIRLRSVSLCCRAIDSYLKRPSRPGLLENALVEILERHHTDLAARANGSVHNEHELRDDEVHQILRNLRLCLAMYGSDPAVNCTDDVDVCGSCLNTLRRLRDYWHAIFYASQ